MKKKFVVFGNCQSRGIAKSLLKSPSFAEKYEHIPTKFVQTIRMANLEDWKQAISNSDLIVYQKISENYKFPSVSESNMLKIAKPDAIKITFPSLYFNAYFPQLGAKIPNQNRKNSLLSKIDDYLWLGLYAVGVSSQQAKTIVIDRNLFSQEEACSFYETSILELQKRESSIQVTASDIYISLYKKFRLGSQFNHPTTVLLNAIGNRILALLNEDEINDEIEPTRRRNDHLHTVGIYPSLYNGLELEFEEDFELYNTLEGSHSLSFVLEKMWKFYENNYTKEHILKSIETKKPWVIPKLKSIGLI